MTLRALEFYSGIGAFAQAASRFDIDIVRAFDQSQSANLTYKSNYDTAPNHRNLDSISAAEIADADLWWMSPPCTPFTRRGNQKGGEDNRARSFFNLGRHFKSQTSTLSFNRKRRCLCRKCSLSASPCPIAKPGL